MRTMNRKLSLHRETVRLLSAQELARARGGTGDKQDDPVYLPDTATLEFSQPGYNGHCVDDTTP